MDPAIATVVVASIAAVGGITSTVIAVRQRPKLDEVHHQVSVNKHTSEHPTVLDRLETLESKVDGLVAAVATLRAVVGSQHHRRS